MHQCWLSNIGLNKPTNSFEKHAKILSQIHWIYIIQAHKCSCENKKCVLEMIKNIQSSIQYRVDIPSPLVCSCAFLFVCLFLFFRFGFGWLFVCSEYNAAIDIPPLPRSANMTLQSRQEQCRTTVFIGQLHGLHELLYQMYLSKLPKCICPNWCSTKCIFLNCRVYL